MVKGTRPTDADGLATRLFPVLVCLVWGSNVPVTRLALDELSPFLAAAIRASIAAVVLGVWRVATLRPVTLGRDEWVPLSVASTLNVAIFVLYYLALSRTSASHAAILIYLYPILTALLAHFCLRGDTVTPRASVGLALGFASAAVTMGDASTRAGRVTLGGDVLALGCACVWATTTVLTKHLLGTSSVWAVQFFPTDAAAVALAGLSIVFEEPPRWPLSWTTSIALAYQGVVATAIASTVWAALLSRRRASVLTSYTFLTPIFGVIGSAFLLNERLSPRVLVALVLVVLGSVIVEGQRQRAPRVSIGECARMDVAGK